MNTTWTPPVNAVAPTVQSVGASIARALGAELTDEGHQFYRPVEWSAYLSQDGSLVPLLVTDPTTPNGVTEFVLELREN